MDLFNKQDYQSALPILKKSLENYRLINDKKGESEALNTLGNIYQNLKQNTEALEFYNKSLAIRKEIGSPKKERM